MDLSLKQSARFFLIFLALTIPVTTFAMTVSEDSIMRRDDSIDAHNRRVGAEMAREKTRAAVTHAKVVYDMSVRLGELNATAKWEVYEKLIDLLHAQLADRVAEHLVTVAGLDEQIGALRHSWRDGTSRVDVALLAQLMVEKRESALRLAEGNLADHRQLADARKAMYEIQDELARRRTVSEEDRHLAMVLKNQTAAEVTIVASELEVAKEHLAEAKRDLDHAKGL